MMLCLIRWDATDHLRFNSALVNAASDLEEALITPVRVPRVSTEPILFAIFNAPAQHANRMTAERAASGVVVNARFVSGEVLVDDESSFDRAVLVDFGHNGFFMGRQAKKQVKNFSEK